MPLVSTSGRGYERPTMLATVKTLSMPVMILDGIAIGSCGTVRMWSPLTVVLAWLLGSWPVAQRYCKGT
jgi:hypothetical protein